MLLRHALAVLRDFQQYRRGEGQYNVDTPTQPQYNAMQIGEAIDTGIEAIEHWIETESPSINHN